MSQSSLRGPGWGSGPCEAPVLYPGPLWCHYSASPQSWKSLGRGPPFPPPRPPASSQDVRATLMPFFHTLFRVGSQSSGWPLSPSSITSTPPRVTCEWVLPSRGGGRLHVYRAMPPVSAAPLGNSAGPECLSAHADHPQLIPAPSCRGFVYSLSNWRGPRQ